MKRASILTLSICLILMPRAWAQGNGDRSVQLTRSAIQAERQAILAANLELDERESAVFWPLYQEYRDTLDAVNNQRAELLEQYFASYETLTDSEASALLQRHLAWEKDVLGVRNAYAKKMGKVLPGKTVARFFQIENKMDLIVEYELAGEIPLVK